jgi:tetratricopeptide (TPR) repeat protein
LIYQRFGLPGLAIGAILVLLWSNWDTVKKLPGVTDTILWFSQAPLPRADPQSFAVALAHLEYDKDQKSELLISNVLGTFKGKGVQLLHLGRTISLKGELTEENEQAGHLQAQQYLKDTKAHVLIWGLILNENDRTAPQLFWTTEKVKKRANEPYIPENFKLPNLFWNDLAEVLGLVVLTYSNQLFSDHEGSFIAEQLNPFITRVRQLLDRSAGRPGWSEVQFAFGTALLMAGTQTGTNQPLEEAVAAYRAVLAEWTLEHRPLEWAGVQNNLGLALWTLGDREPGTARLEEAVAACRAALTVQSQERAPVDWAITQNNLGVALWMLGEREMDTARLEEAVAAYHAALTERTQERVPLEWARTQQNLCLTLWRLGERETGTVRLEEAVTACQGALTEQTQERVPLEWAGTQHNLGLALMTLGERTQSATLVCEALEKQLMAWEVVTMGLPSNATHVANGAKMAVATLKNAFDLSTYKTCVTKHVEALKRMGLP